MSPLLLFALGKFLTTAPPLGGARASTPARVTTTTAKRPDVQRKAAATPAPWPAPVPRDLPPFPAGWEYDQPPRPEVVARAAQLIPVLWAKGLGARAVEYVGGRWLTFVAAEHAGKRAVEAYRVRKAPAKPAPRPSAKPAPRPSAKPAPRPSAKPAPRPAAPDVKAIAASALKLADSIRNKAVTLPFQPSPKPAVKPAPRPAARPTPRPAPRPSPSENAIVEPRDDDIFVPPPTIRQGATGPTVAQAQSALNRRGASLRVDSIFGPLTTAATKTFQRSEGLVVDGIIGPKTWEALLT